MEPSDAPAVEVTSLRKGYGDVEAVDDVSFKVERGSIFYVIGPNGTGKTTTIECLEGLCRPDGGSVLVAGLDPMADRARLVHMSPAWRFPLLGRPSPPASAIRGQRWDCGLHCSRQYSC